MNHEQEIQEQKSRLLLEEMQKKRDLEDKLRNAQSSREDLEVRTSEVKLWMIVMKIIFTFRKGSLQPPKCYDRGSTAKE